MTAEELIARHPCLYHVTTPGAWESIRVHGLLSTETLLRRAGLAEAEVQKRIRRHRKEREVLETAAIGRVVLNDNSSLQMGKLARCLDDGFTAEDWLAMLNRRVFFWVTKAKAETFANAAINRGNPRELRALDTARVVAASAGRVQIAPFNTGNTLFNAVRRGLATFTPLGTMPYAQWRQLRRDHKSSPDEVVEVVFLDGVPDVARHLVECKEVRCA